MHVIDEKRSSLKDTSYDRDNKEYMVDNQLQVCSFDEVKEWYIGNRIPLANPNPKSNDALFLGEEESFFIEFKNGKIDNTVNFELSKKIFRDGTDQANQCRICKAKRRERKRKKIISQG